VGLNNRILFVYRFGPFLRLWPPIKISGGLYFSEGHYSRYPKETIATKVSELKVVGNGGFV